MIKNSRKQFNCCRWEHFAWFLVCKDLQSWKGPPPTLILDFFQGVLECSVTMREWHIASNQTIQEVSHNLIGESFIPCFASAIHVSSG